MSTVLDICKFMKAHVVKWKIWKL